jgi:CHAD domain-containing protein
MTAAAPLDAHALLAPILTAGIADVRAAAGRVLASTSKGASDDEAVHDFRVAIRRLRTALRPARGVYGRKKLRTIAEELGAVARASGALRDEEVLRETLASLELTARWRAVVDRWLKVRKPQERARRARLAALIRGTVRAGALPSLATALAALEARLVQRGDPPAAAKLARRSLADAERGVEARLHVEANDVPGLHELRIRFKRLRYTAELFSGFCGARGEAIGQAAAKMQKRLGDVHDFDEAAVRVTRARSLDDRARRAILAALRAGRAAKVARALAERDGWPPST